MRSRCVLTLALFLHTTLSFASQLVPTLDEQGVGVSIEGSAWPATLTKDLISGLTNRILVRVRLFRGAEFVQQRAVEIGVRYDLWDERFAMTVTLDGIETEARVFQTTEEMLAALHDLSVHGVFASTKFAAGQPHTITTEVLLNPIDRERMEVIRKWVAENSGGPTDIGASTAGGGWGINVFNRIFEQYSKGADFAAVWRETAASRPFRLEDLSDETR